MQRGHRATDALTPMERGVLTAAVNSYLKKATRSVSNMKAKFGDGVYPDAIEVIERRALCLKSIAKKLDLHIDEENI